MESVFSYFISRDGESKEVVDKRYAYSFWFIESFPEPEFHGIERYYYRAIELAVKLNTPCSERFIETYINAELKGTVARTKERVPGTETLFVEDITQLETATRIVGDLMRTTFNELLIHPTGFDNFIPDMTDFMGTRLSQRVYDIMAKSYEMLNTVTDNKLGPEDTASYMNYETQMVLEIYDKSKLEDISEKIKVMLDPDNKGFKFSFNTGIKAIDKDMGGIYTTQLFGIEAPPGTGKTNFAIGVIGYSAAVTYKKNLWFGTLEQSKDEIEAMFVSLHIFYLFNKQVAFKSILVRDMSPEVERMYEVAKEDLFESGKYGKIIIEECKLYVDNFTNKFKMLDILHGIDVYVVDYMALMEVSPPKPGEYKKDLPDWKIVQIAYRKFKAFCRHRRKVGVAINQLNREGIEKAKAGKLSDQNDAQGGIEVYRSTDYNVVISATPEMEAMKTRQLHNPKKRNAEGIGVLLMDVRMAFCYWFNKKQGL